MTRDEIEQKAVERFPIIDTKFESFTYNNVDQMIKRKAYIEGALMVMEANNELIEGLKAITRECNNYNDSHEPIWRIADRLLNKHPK